MLASTSRVMLARIPASRYAAAAFSTAAVCRQGQVKEAAAPAPAKGKGPARAASILPAGTPMPGLSVLKDKPDPVALADEEYPAWLWTILDEPVATSKEGEFDFYAERKKLRAKNKANIKAANYLKTT